MFFQLGYLYLEPNESICIGDPCYINTVTSFPLTITYNQPWYVSDGRKKFEDLYKQKNDLLNLSENEFSKAISEIKDEINDIIDGPVKLTVYVDMQIDTMFGGQPRPACLVIIPSRESARNKPSPDPTQYELRAVEGSIGVDSGQISVMSSDIASKWTKAQPIPLTTSDEDEVSSFENPKNDYDASCNVTLYSQLGAGSHECHKVYNLHGYPSTVTASAFSSRTFYGDGSFGVFEMLDIQDKHVAGLMIHLGGDYEQLDRLYAEEEDINEEENNEGNII